MATIGPMRVHAVDVHGIIPVIARINGTKYAPAEMDFVNV
jgi:hypothetical protein